MWADGLFEFCKTKNNNFVIIFSIVWVFFFKFTGVYFSLNIPPIYGTTFTARSTKFLWKPRVISKQLKFALDSNQNRPARPKAFSLAWFSRQIRYRNPWNFCLWNLEAQKILLLASGILGFGIRNTAQRIRNPSNDWNPESNFYWKRLEMATGIWNPLREIQNPKLSWIPLYGAIDRHSLFTTSATRFAIFNPERFSFSVYIIP